MKGRVIIIDNETTPKMIVKEKYVLARTMNVELIPSWSHADTGRSGGLKQIKARKPNPNLEPELSIQEIIKKETEKPLAEQYRDLALKSAELVFL